MTKSSIKRQIPNTVSVIGLGRVGRIVSQYLLHKKNFVYAYDENKSIFNQKENIGLVHNQFLKPISDYKLLMKNPKPKFAICSPGFSDNHKVVRSLQKNHIPILDEIEFTQHLLARRTVIKQKVSNKTAHNLTMGAGFTQHALRTMQDVSRVIAITGTNGKSTTTSLIGRILDADGKNVFWGGNLAPGLPFAMTLFQEPKDYYIIEVSSFQLQRCKKFHPYIAVLLNVTSDHLDRHRNLKEYREAKFNIFANQTQKDYAVINYEDETSMKYCSSLQSQIIYFSRNRKTNGAYLKKHHIYFREEKICDFNKVKLLGSHFIDSILASVSIAKLNSVKNQTIANVLSSFAGLEHRLEFVAEINNVKYINNSMCTNPSAGAATLKVFTKPVILIVGGKEKNLGLSEYIEEITKKAKQTILIGDNRERLAQHLKQANYMNFHFADSLKQAVLIARKLAISNDIILFSPGFASFDNFTNFQERGKTFKEIIYGLA